MSREKLSTTVSADTFQFLQEMVKRGNAANLAEAVDAVVDRIRRLENRRHLAGATARYFGELDPKVSDDEDALAHDLSAASGAIDFEREL